MATPTFYGNFVGSFSITALSVTQLTQTGGLTSTFAGPITSTANITTTGTITANNFVSTGGGGSNVTLSPGSAQSGFINVTGSITSGGTVSAAVAFAQAGTSTNTFGGGATFGGGVTAATFTGNLAGNVTGNITGNITGMTGAFSGAVSGSQFSGNLIGGTLSATTGNFSGALTGVSANLSTFLNVGAPSTLATAAGQLFTSGRVATINTNGVLGFYNILDYGADPTGVTDCHTQIQAAINAGSTSGGAYTIFVPNGIYNVGTTGITVPTTRPCTLLGASKWGAIITGAPASASAAVVTMNLAYPNGLHSAQSLSINTTTSGSALYVGELGGATQGITFSDLNLYGTSKSTSIAVNGLLVVQGGNGWDFNSIRCSLGNIAMTVQGNSNSAWSNCHFLSATMAVVFQGGTGGVPYSFSQGMMFSNCHIQDIGFGDYTHGPSGGAFVINSAGTNSLTVTNCLIDGLSVMFTSPVSAGNPLGAGITNACFSNNYMGWSAYGVSSGFSPPFADFGAGSTLISLVGNTIVEYPGTGIAGWAPYNVMAFNGTNPGTGGAGISGVTFVGNTWDTAVCTTILTSNYTDGMYFDRSNQAEYNTSTTSYWPPNIWLNSNPGAPGNDYYVHPSNQGFGNDSAGDGFNCFVGSAATYGFRFWKGTPGTTLMAQIDPTGQVTANRFTGAVGATFPFIAQQTYNVGYVMKWNSYAGGVTNLSATNIAVSGAGVQANRFSLDDGTTIFFGIDSAGDVGMTGGLYVVGTAQKTGGGGWAVLSDERFKRNIAPYEKSLDAILALHPITYEYNERSGPAETGKTHVGFSAQEVQTIHPEMVSLRTTEEFGEQLILDTSDLTPMLVNALKEIAARLTALEGAHT